MDDGWATFSSVGLIIFSVCTFVSLGHGEWDELMIQFDD